MIIRLFFQLSDIQVFYLIENHCWVTLHDLLPVSCLFLFFPLHHWWGCIFWGFIKNGDDVLKLLVEWSLRRVVHKRQRSTFIHVIRLVTVGTLMSQEVFVTKCEINCLKALLGLEGNLLLSNSASLFFGALRSVAWKVNKTNVSTLSLTLLFWLFNSSKVPRQLVKMTAVS